MKKAHIILLFFVFVNGFFLSDWFDFVFVIFETAFHCVTLADLELNI